MERGTRRAKSRRSGSEDGWRKAPGRVFWIVRNDERLEFNPLPSSTALPHAGGEPVSLESLPVNQRHTIKNNYFILNFFSLIVINKEKNQIF